MILVKLSVRVRAARFINIWIRINDLDVLVCLTKLGAMFFLRCQLRPVVAFDRTWPRVLNKLVIRIDQTRLYVLDWNTVVITEDLSWYELLWVIHLLRVVLIGFFAWYLLAFNLALNTLDLVAWIFREELWLEEWPVVWWWLLFDALLANSGLVVFHWIKVNGVVIWTQGISWLPLGFLIFVIDYNIDRGLVTVVVFSFKTQGFKLFIFLQT